VSMEFQREMNRNLAQRDGRDRPFRPSVER
jgi:hypothetical protein